MGCICYSKAQHKIHRKLTQPSCPVKVVSFCKHCTKYLLPWSMQVSKQYYETRLRKLNLMSLKNRRFLADVTFLYKPLNGLCNINIDSYIDFYSNADHYSFRKYDLSLRRNMQEQIHRKVDSWNLLPYDTRKAVNVNIFKRGVKKFLSDNTLN